MGTVVNDDDVQRIMSANIYPDYHSQRASLSLFHILLQCEFLMAQNTVNIVTLVRTFY